MTATLGWILALLCAAPVGAAPLDALRDCAHRADPATRGVAALERECPGLDAALQALGYLTSADAAGRNDLSPAALDDLAALSERYAPGREGRAPDTAPVKRIAAGLARAQQQPHSWWEVIRTWLRSLVEQESEGGLSRWGHWLGRLAGAAGALEIVLAALLAAVLVAAVLILIRELRTAGVLSRRAAPAVRPPVAVAPGRAPIPALEGSAPADRPAILLRLLVQALARQGRLQGAPHLTYGELVDRAVLDDEEHRARFQGLVRLAERMMYGPGTGRPAAERVDAIVEAGRELLLQIERMGRRA